MEEESDEVPVNKVAKRVKKMQIDDCDVSDWDQVKGSFPEHFHVQNSSRFLKRFGSATPVPCLYSDLFCDQKNILCGLENGICKTIDLQGTLEDEISVDPKRDKIHAGLSCVRCSRVTPQIFFSSSSSDGTIKQWDGREDGKKPCQKYITEGVGVSNKSSKKPILQFDVSCNDQLICAGTELVEEDSYLLFWDVRSTKLLGAYWESHSDDVTAIRFHPSQAFSLASGSTDGLVNVFNLKEPEEDDALLYSFNTNSSVDSVHWYCSPGSDPNIACVTHTNEVQVWNTNTGDPVVEIKREPMAKAMMRSNPDAVYITGCHNLNVGGGHRMGLIANSLSGSGNTRLIQLNHEMKPAPLGMFMDQTSVVQTAQFVSDTRQWLTFDENGVIKIWKSSDGSSPKKISKQELSKREERRSAKRFKPYDKN